MPCRSDYLEPSPAEHKKTRETAAEIRNVADALTAANDGLREHLLGGMNLRQILKYINRGEYLKTELARLLKINKNLYIKVDSGLITHTESLLMNYHYLNALVVDGSPINDEEMRRLDAEQVKHREEDLSRLMKVFAASGDRVRLKKVLDADSSKPLDPQLGFSPDEF